MRQQMHEWCEREQYRAEDAMERGSGRYYFLTVIKEGAETFCYDSGMETRVCLGAMELHDAMSYALNSFRPERVISIEHIQETPTRAERILAWCEGRRA